MNLYEITTGSEGASYERCYVWAPDENTANAIYDSTHGNEIDRQDTKLLFSSDAAPFITKLDTDGWRA